MLFLIGDGWLDIARFFIPLTQQKNSLRWYRRRNLFQERMERMIGMMLRLVMDILSDRIQTIRGDREGAIMVLPLER